MIASYGKMSEMPKRKKKRFSAVQTVKAMARERIGAPPGSRVSPIARRKNPRNTKQPWVGCCRRSEMTSRLAFRSAVTDALDTRAPDQHRVRSTEACICLRAGSDMASGTESGNTLKFQETVYTFPDILRSPGDGAGTQHRFIVNS